MTIQIQGKSENVHLLSKKMRTRLRTKKMQTLTKKMQTLTKKIPLIGELILARKEAKSTTHLYQKSKCPQFNNLSTSRQPRLISLLERVKKCEHFSVWTGRTPYLLLWTRCTKLKISIEQKSKTSDFNLTLKLALKIKTSFYLFFIVIINFSP